MNKKLMLGVTSLLLISNIWGTKLCFRKIDYTVNQDLESGCSDHIIDIPLMITESRKQNRGQQCTILRTMSEVKSILDNSIFQEFRDMGLDVPVEVVTDTDNTSSDETEEDKPSLTLVQQLMLVLFGVRYNKEKIE